MNNWSYLISSWYNGTNKIWLWSF